MFTSYRSWVASLVISLLLMTLAHAAPQAATLAPRPAEKTPNAAQAPMLAAASAGARLIAVGDYGIVVLSDDDGKTWRQANRVPVSSALTSVQFVDDRQGWAVGHWGVILHTSDGGESWTIQRLDTKEDRPLFSVYFFDAKAGVAVGLWSLILVTSDGGATWTKVRAPQPPEGGKGDRNLFAAFAGRDGDLWVAAERGALLHTADRGLSWSYVTTGYKGSFWAGMRLATGTLLAAGLRGTVYRSADDGRSWQAVPSNTKSSITGIVEANGEVQAYGLDGVKLSSSDDGLTFRVQQRDDRVSFAAAVATHAAVVPVGKAGVMNP